MLIAERIADYDLPRAIATVTANPAASVGLDDRGAIAPGLRADLVRLRRTRHVPRVMAVWKAGERVA
jgi:alpha-D-ribose 1-methylphosphonate 5-triphosphate diphosphatase